MHRFINADNLWYKQFKSELEDGYQRVFRNCSLPYCCSRTGVTIAVQKDHYLYRLSINGGVTCNTDVKNLNVKLFKQLLKYGEIMFLDFNDLKMFLKGLRILY